MKKYFSSFLVASTVASFTLACGKKAKVKPTKEATQKTTSAKKEKPKMVETKNYAVEKNTKWFFDEKPVQETNDTQIAIYKDKKLHSVQTYKDKKLVSEITYKTDIKEFKEFYPNGKVKFYYDTKGVRKTYYEDGSLKERWPKKVQPVPKPSESKEDKEYLEKATLDGEDPDKAKDKK